jgi:hypothetical protein
MTSKGKLAPELAVMETDRNMNAASRNKTALRLIAMLVAVAVVVCLAIAVYRARQRAYASACHGKLSQLVLAIRHYQEIHGNMPPAFVADDAGRPAHSWRVLILPFMGKEDAYAGYTLSEPWNGPQNSEWAKKHRDLAQIFKCPSDSSAGEYTSYLAATGTGSLWPGSEPHHLTAADAARVLLVEVRQSSVHWMEPRDLPYDQIESSAHREADGSSDHSGTTHQHFAAGDGTIGNLE